MIKSIITKAVTGVAATLVFGLASANAALVTGDDFTLDATNTGGFVNDYVGTIGAGSDLTIFAVDIDANSGPDEDILDISFDGAFGGMFGLSGTTTLTFTLPVMAGSSILSFDLLSSAYAGTVATVVGNVLTISFLDGPSGPGTVLSGQFTFADADAVPLPGAALLFLTAIAGGTVARRKAAA